MLKALIVDDDINVGQCLRKLIGWDKLGYEVVGEAYNGNEAFQMAIESNPDVIICDIKMPVMDGTELCKKIRETMDDVAIIFLSAYEDFSTAQLALRFNVTEYILKPISESKIKILEEILEELAVNYKSRDYFNGLLRNESLEKEFLAHLIDSDAQYFIAFFDAFTNCIAGDFSIIREVCFKLIKILYEYLQFLGMEPRLIEKNRSRANQELLTLKKKKDMVTYAGKMYFDVLQFSNTRQEDYYHNLMNSIKSYIQHSFADYTFNVSSVADQFNFSPDYIGKLFKTYSGSTISNYIADRRMEKALELLRDTDVPINDITGIVGYASHNYFSRVFKAKQRMSPSEYRSKMRLISRDGKDI